MSSQVSRREIPLPTSAGEARLLLHEGGEAARVTLVMTHGAGGGIGALDLVALADALPAHGVRVVLVEMPWRVQGKKLAPRPAAIDVAYRAVIQELAPAEPFVIGGRSAGARSACRIGADVGAAAVLALSFPLHPPGQPDKTRVAELNGAGLPTLVVQGGSDPFGRPQEFPPDTEMAVVPEADHGMKAPKRAGVSPEDVAGIVVESTLEWLMREVTVLD